MSSFPPRKFPKSKTTAKIPSRGFAKGNSKLASRKFSKAPEAAGKMQGVAALPARPISDNDRKDRFTTVKEKLKSVSESE